MELPDLIKSSTSLSYIKSQLDSIIFTWLFISTLCYFLLPFLEVKKRNIPDTDFHISCKATFSYWWCPRIWTVNTRPSCMCVHVNANVCVCMQISIFVWLSIYIWHVYCVCFVCLQYIIVYVPVQYVCICVPFCDSAIVSCVT